MRRHLPGLHSGHPDLVSNLEGLFLVRVERASYRWLDSFAPAAEWEALSCAAGEPRKAE